MALAVIYAGLFFVFGIKTRCPKCGKPMNFLAAKLLGEKCTSEHLGQNTIPESSNIATSPSETPSNRSPEQKLADEKAMAIVFLVLGLLIAFGCILAVIQNK
jgi:hypothetical protein